MGFSFPDQDYSKAEQSAAYPLILKEAVHIQFSNSFSINVDETFYKLVIKNPYPLQLLWIMNVRICQRINLHFSERYLIIVKDGCANQAWDLASLSSWSQLLDMKERGRLYETFLFATMDEMLKKIIVSGLWGMDMLPFLHRAFNSTELRDVLVITSQLQSEERKRRLDHLMNRDYLCELAANEESRLRVIVEA